MQHCQVHRVAKLRLQKSLRPIFYEEGLDGEQRLEGLQDGERCVQWQGW